MILGGKVENTQKIFANTMEGKNLVEVLMIKVFIDYNGMKFIESELKKPPEACGSMDIDFKAGSYYLSDFREESFDRSGGWCIPQTRLGGGVWHTHPPNMPKASERDIKTMKDDLISAISSDTPGIPPLSLISSLTNGKPEITVYIPTFEVKMDEEKVPYLLNSSPTKFSLPQWMQERDDRKFFYHFLLFRGEEKIDKLTEKRYYEVQEFLPIYCSSIKDSDGVFIGSKVPIHLIPLLITYFAKHSKRNFLVLRENEGMFELSVKSYKEKIIEVGVDISSPKFGHEQRLELLSDLSLQRLREYRIALFGGGFLGSPIASALAKYFGEIVVVDNDFVGPENVGYQEYYTQEDVGVEKACALAKKLEQTHPQAKIYGVKANVPSFDCKLPKVVEEIVNWADCVITAFDTIHPRLTLQVACSKYSRPLVDAGVGTYDGTIRTWLPGTDYSCIGCYAYFSSVSGRNIYVADPEVARLIASTIAKICIELARGEKVINLIEIDLGKIDLSKGEFEFISSNEWKKIDDCPFCSAKVRFEIDLGEGAKLIIEADKEKSIRKFEEDLRKIFGKSVELKCLRNKNGEKVDYSHNISRDANLILLKTLERQGLKLYLK